MSDAAALLAAIRAAPDDDAPRLIYADWLEEHGQPERAEFIRIQCELARKGSRRLRQREAELLAEHHDSFAGKLAVPGIRFVFKRGFIHALGHTGYFIDWNRKTDVMYSFRFYPDGVAIDDARGIVPLKDLVQEFRRENRDYKRGTYRITSDHPLPEIEIEFVDRDIDMVTQYRGVLKKSIFHLESRVNNERWFRPRRYKHTPIKGVDSSDNA